MSLTAEQPTSSVQQRNEPPCYEICLRTWTTNRDVAFDLAVEISKYLADNDQVDATATTMGGRGRVKGRAGAHLCRDGGSAVGLIRLDYLQIIHDLVDDTWLQALAAVCVVARWVGVWSFRTRGLCMRPHRHRAPVARVG